MINISIDETYHIDNNKPLYKTRYKKVMSFHDGIAPVEDECNSFFIDKESNILFNRKFLKAYGFYDGLSAVKDENGWFHINKIGSDIYKIRYSWIGNFCENKCVVRDFDNNYFHIDLNGKRLYKKNYNYTGDFKYGIAVAINKDGKATHIKEDGSLLHNKIFDGLDIFHKGCAIAKDYRGYFHIDKNGDELYSQRYKKIEPFYNSCAFVTTLENQKIILQEDDLNTFNISEITIDKNKILNDSFGYFKYQILFSILKLDVLDSLKNNNKINLPNVSKDLILKWLKVENIIDVDNDLTKLGFVIENELKPIILYWQDLPFKNSSNMVKTLEDGDEIFSVNFGSSYFDFLEKDKYQQELFIKMSSYYTTDYNYLINNLDLNNELVCDIGGGNGNLLTNIKALYPDINTLVADKFLQQNNHKFKKIDFFKAFTINCDIFVLSRVLHDWSDENVMKILRNISTNMNKDTIFYLFETIVPQEPTSDKGITLSFHLLNMVGGYERTLSAFNVLFKQCDLEIISIYYEDDLISLIKIKKYQDIKNDEFNS